MKENEERSGKMKKGTICFECGAKDTYELRETVREYEGDGYHFEIIVKSPFCKNCGTPIYDEEIEKEIAQLANKKIREQREIITREEILEILESYHISQKFLSKLLGWGDITLTRYINGNYAPNSSNSNRLKQLKNPYYFQMLLQIYCEEKIETGEEKLINKAQNGVLDTLIALEKLYGKIINVVNWFLSQSSKEEPITHLALQKLLYFAQSWSTVLLDKSLFFDDCEAWEHGAVYTNIYEIFKIFKYHPLPKMEGACKLENNEIKLLKAIKKYYFDVYSPKALEEICHREEPYLRTRKEFNKEEKSYHVIEKEEIYSYYYTISQKYNISLEEMSNIKVYLNIILSY